MEKTDITIIGAGVIGLAIAYFLSGGKREVTVIEKNPSFGQETSSRNSEVIHTGIYYPKASLKARTCIRGRELLYKLCAKRKIPCRKAGKLIVALRRKEIEALEEIHKNALDCGIKTLRFLDRGEVPKFEPAVEAKTALFSPEAGILDTHAFMNYFFVAAKERGVDFVFSVEAKDIKRQGSFYKVSVKEPQGGIFSFKTDVLINSAGLWADKIAELVGINPDEFSYRIHYCKGKYFRARNPKKFSIEHLVYPPPTKIDLGIHATPDMGGGLRFGPDATYIDRIEYDIKNEDSKVFLNSLKDFLPTLSADDIIPDTVGIRPKLQTGDEAFRDFVIRNEEDKGFPNFINLIGIESPGLTAALAIGEIVCSGIR